MSYLDFALTLCYNQLYQMSAIVLSWFPKTDKVTRHSNAKATEMSLKACLFFYVLMTILLYLRFFRKFSFSSCFGWWHDTAEKPDNQGFLRFHSEKLFMLHSADPQAGISMQHKNFKPLTIVLLVCVPSPKPK